MASESLTGKLGAEILKSLFQEDFSCVEARIQEAFEYGLDKTKLFEMLLCEHFKEIKKCGDMQLKVTAVRNALRALSYLEGK